MRTRKMLGLCLMILGLVQVTAGLSAIVFHYISPPSNGLIVVVGILFTAVGLVVLITETLEAWLSRGQAALVDGLQAG